MFVNPIFIKEGINSLRNFGLLKVITKIGMLVFIDKFDFIILDELYSIIPIIKLKMKKVAIIIPIYKTSITHSEELSLSLLEKNLKKYTKIVIYPNSISLPKRLNPNVYKFLPLSKKYFLSTKTYSQLLLSRKFYKSFSEYEYVLIYQLDGIVMSSELNKFLSLGFSYIGAPWPYSFLSLILNRKRNFFNVTGNGGISLRKISDFLSVFDAEKEITGSKRSKKLIPACLRYFTSKKISFYPFNEDGFWSIEAVKYFKDFSVAPVKFSAQFSLEKNAPYYSKKFLKDKLPLFSHAWSKYNKNWWQKRFINEYETKH